MLRKWIAVLTLAVFGVTAPSAALNHHVEDFRLDSAAAASDTARHLDAGWGDSLLINAKFFNYATILNKTLSDAPTSFIENNGYFSASPIASAVDRYSFKVAYIAWDNTDIAHTNASYPLSRIAASANLVTRKVIFSPDTIAIDAKSNLISFKENVPTNTAPYCFNYSALGDRYSAYWGSLTNNVAIRRTTHKDTTAVGNTWGKTVQNLPLSAPPGADTSAGYGMVSACAVPGSNGSRSMTVVEGKNPGGSRLKIRWEDIDNNTSVSVLSPQRPMLPYDMAIAADSSGNSVVLWREANALYLISYDNAHAIRQDTVKLMNTVYYNDVPYNNTLTPEHAYRPYAVASMKKNNYLIVYSIAGSVYYRTLLITPTGPVSYTLGTETGFSDPAVFSMYPDISVTADRVAIAWFEKTATADKYLMKGSVFPKVVADIDTASNQFKRQDFTLDTLNFTGQPVQWHLTHFLHSASVAMDDRGNVMAAYDNGYHAKFSLIRNNPTFYDSAVFRSRVFAIRNPALPLDIFNPGVDSVKFLSLGTSGDDTRIKLELETAKDSLFTVSPSGFQILGPNRIQSHGFYRYQATISSNPADGRHTTPKLKNLDIFFDVKPRKPVVDSIQIGGTAMKAYLKSDSLALLPRKDSLKIVLSGFDFDDGGLSFRVYMGNQSLTAMAGTRTSTGRFKATLALMPPDTLMNPLKLLVTTVDDRGWISNADTLTFNYKNVVPTQALKVFKRQATEIAGVYNPIGGGTDTLTPTQMGLIVSQVGDTLIVKGTYADGNDDSVTTRWSRNGGAPVVKKILNSDTLTFRLPVVATVPGASPVDTISVGVGDKDTTVVLKFRVRPNRVPALDSLAHTGYKNRDSVWVYRPFDKIRNFLADTGLVVPLGLPALLEAGISDADQAFGDPIQLRWYAWKKGSPACETGDLTCYQISDSIVGVGFTHTFSIAEEYLTLRVSDQSGAFLERKVRLEYSVADSGKGTSTGLAAAALTLNGGIGFILGTDTEDTTVTAVLKSAGTTPLRIDSLRTFKDDQKWLGVTLSWLTGSPPIPRSIQFDGSTANNALKAGDSVLLNPFLNPNLNITFRFTSKDLVGDSTLSDTLYLYTNDFANPVLRIPFRMKYDDLPRVRVGVPGSKPAGAPDGFNSAGLPAYMPARSTLSFSFTETVRITDTNTIQIYSYLDSLKNPRNYRPIKGRFDYLRKASGLPKTGAGLSKNSAAAPGNLADTLVFTPAYDHLSDSLKVKPPPGFFLYRDIIHIAFRNLITDTAGNNLDLRLNRSRQALGSFDTIFEAKVDTGFFKVAQTRPTSGQSGWDPDQPIRIRFNRKLAQRPPAGNDTLTLLDLKAVRGDSNRYVSVTSLYQGAKRYNFQYLALEDGDSTLVFKTRPRFPAYDTVTVTLSGGLVDTSGLSLDGNGNRFPDWLYSRSDTTDRFSFTFQTRDQDFYVYPNPYRFSDSRHREKGSITFKNLNTLEGFVAGQEVVLRIHAMTGDLIYNSRDAGPLTGSKAVIYTSLDWEMKNRSGTTVGTGVYIFTLTTGNSKLLRKGKVAVVR